MNFWFCVFRNNHKAQENFEGEANKKFNLKKFRKSSIRKVYDSLHGLSDEAIPLSNAVEIMAYCLVDGKVEQESAFETNLYNNLLKKFKEMKAGFKTFTISIDFRSHLLIRSLTICIPRTHLFENQNSIFQNEHLH